MPIFSLGKKLTVSVHFCLCTEVWIANFYSKDLNNHDSEACGHVQCVRRNGSFVSHGLMIGFISESWTIQLFKLVNRAV